MNNPDKEKNIGNTKRNVKFGNISFKNLFGIFIHEKPKTLP